MQEIFNHMLKRVALRSGYASAENYVSKELGGVVYHFTLNFMGGHTLEHCDEINADGPGRWIFNLSLQGAGLLYFVEDMERPDGHQLGMHCVWQVIQQNTHTHEHINTHTNKHSPSHHRTRVTASGSVVTPGST